MKKHPCDGGCWFCHTDDGDMLFSTEFDCYLHEQCLRQETDDNPEKEIMMNELFPEELSDVKVRGKTIKEWQRLVDEGNIDLIVATIDQSSDKINTHVGAMEKKSTLKEIRRGMRGQQLTLELIEKSKHHNGKPMIHIYEEPNTDTSPACDVSIYHLEISDDGVFPYIFDDSVS